MKDWQVPFHIIPARALSGRPRSVPVADLESRDWWAEFDLPDYEARLFLVAPLTLATSDHVLWGNEDTNRVDVWLHGGQPVRITAAVDVRKLDSKFGAMLLVFVKSAEAVLVRSDGLVVDATISAYSGALRNSDAWKYASDPAAWIAAQKAAGESLE